MSLSTYIGLRQLQNVPYVLRATPGTLRRTTRAAFFEVEASMAASTNAPDSPDAKDTRAGSLGPVTRLFMVTHLSWFATSRLVSCLCLLFRRDPLFLFSSLRNTLWSALVHLSRRNYAHNMYSSIRRLSSPAAVLLRKYGSRHTWSVSSPNSKHCKPTSQMQSVR